VTRKSPGRCGTGEKALFHTGQKLGAHHAAIRTASAWTVKYPVISERFGICCGYWNFRQRRRRSPQNRPNFTPSDVTEKRLSSKWHGERHTK